MGDSVTPIATVRLLAGAELRIGRAPCCDCDGPRAPGEKRLSDAEKKQVEELKKIDQEVRAHEEQHLAAAGQHAQGDAHYRFVTGPDGKRYAIAGNVKVDTSPVAGDPEATVRKLKQVQGAAFAPGDASGQDLRVANELSSAIRQAKELSAEEREERKRNGEPGQQIDYYA